MTAKKSRNPTPPKRLGTFAEVRREMFRVYCDMRRGDIQGSEGTKLVYVLGAIRDVLIAEDFEARLARLEESK